MVIRFFILQTHYRSTLDFSNEALQASEKGLKRLWEAYENLKKLSTVNGHQSTDKELDEKVHKLVSEFDDFMNDDFSTAKVLANMFELVPVINGIKDKHIAADALSAGTIEFLQQKMKLYIEDILGLQMHVEGEDNKLDGIINLLINMRKDARAKKDYAASDRIRNELLTLGIQLKDEKDGNISYTIN
jgi:cysteinyl-tRNA synthetase